MKVTQRCLVFALVSGSTISAPVYADFGIMNQTENASTYGNAQTETFRKAITGGSPVPPEDIVELSSQLPEREDARYYGRVRMNYGTLTLDQIKNRATGRDSAGAVTKKRTSVSQTGLEIAVGYAWSLNARADIEYLVNKNLTYVANPVLTGSGLTARQLDAQIKSNVLLLNGYYEFSGLHRLKPYLTVGVGPSMHSVQTSVTPGSPARTDSATQRSLRLAYSLGAGARMRMYSRWYLDVSYRYMNLGNGVRLMPSSSFKLLSTYSMSAVSLGLVYLF